MNGADLHPAIIGALKQHSGRKHVLLTGRASAGIEAALQVWGAAGRRVAIPANTCYAVLWAVIRAGGIPLLVDIDAAHGAFTTEILNGLSVQPDILIPAHMYGMPAPMPELVAWAEARGVHVIEDAALSVVTQHTDQVHNLAGRWGDCSVLSFGAGKIVDNGMGGALLTDDEAFARDCARVLAAMPRLNDDHLARMNQWAQIYWALHQFEEENDQLPTLYPALYDMYNDLMAFQLDANDWGEFPAYKSSLIHREWYGRLYAVLPEDEHVKRLSARTLERPLGVSFWKWPLFVQPEHRDPLLQYLWEHGQHEVTRWYPVLQPMARALLPQHDFLDSPNAARWSASILNLPLPIQGATGRTQVAAVVQSIRDYAREYTG